MKKDDCWYNKVCSNDCDGCIRYAEMKYLMDHSGIPVSRQYPQELIAGVDLEPYTELATIKSNILDFVNSGQNLFICSHFTGNGKTSWALKLMLKYFDTVWAGNGFVTRGLFVNVPTLLLQLKNFSNPLSEDYKKNLMNVDLVVWDEIASTSISNYDYGNLLMFLDYRILTGKSNIFTSNAITAAELENNVGSKLASRIWNTSTIIKFSGKDRRNGSTSNNFQNFSHKR